LAGSSFYVHQLEQQGCKQSLSCAIKPPGDLNKKTSSLLALGEGAEVDLRDGDFTLEVKSAAYVQLWQQEKPSVISFPIEQRVATGYVFCLLAEQNSALVDPRDVSQWRFWVVPTAKLHAERKSIGLQALIRAHGNGSSYGELANRIDKLRPPAAP
jgi:hypothetical protein